MILNSLNWQVLRGIGPYKKPYHYLRQIFAKNWSNLFFPVYIGITGSVGKTTTKEAIAAVLSCEYKTIATKDNLDPVFNIPQTLLNIRPSTQMVVLEMGIEYPNEMDYYLTLAKPEIGVLTAIYWTHTEFLRDIDGVIAEKLKLIRSLSRDNWAILNYDDSIVPKLAGKTQAKIIWIGSNAKKCQIYYKNFKQDLNGAKFTLYIGRDKLNISWPLIGRHNLVSALAAAATGYINELKLLSIKNGLESLKPQPHRLNITSTKFGTKIIDDSYNSSPIAVKAAIETLSDLADKRRKVVVLGEMKELGTYSKQGHKEAAKEIIKHKISRVYLAGGETKIISESLKKSKFRGFVYFSESVSKLVKILKKDLTKNDIILIKGSRHTHLERLVNLLQGQDAQIECNYCGKLSL